MHTRESNVLKFGWRSHHLISIMLPHEGLAVTLQPYGEVSDIAD